MERVRRKRTTQAMYIPPGRRTLEKNKETTEEFKEPFEENKEPSEQYKEPSEQYEEPSEQYKEPSEQFEEPYEKTKEPDIHNLIDMKESFTDDEVNIILSSFGNLSIQDDSTKKNLEDALIKFSKMLLQGINQSSSAVIEQLVVILITQGKTLQDDNPTELDSLIDLIRDKILEKETLPSTKRYLFHVVESRAREFRLV